MKFTLYRRPSVVVLGVMDSFEGSIQYRRRNPAELYLKEKVAGIPRKLGGY